MEIKKRKYQEISEGVFDAENNVISAMLHDRRLCEDAFHILKPSDFLQSRNKILFNAIKVIFDNNRPIDLVTIKNYLLEKKQYDLVGGKNYLLSLVDNFFSTDNFEEYLRIIIEKSGKRKIFNILKKSEEKINSDISLSEIINDLEEEISKVNFSNNSLDINKLGYEITPLIEKIKNYNVTSEEDRGIYSGIKSLDKITNGFQKGDLIIIASRPSVGKTALALNFMLNVANSRMGVVVFSLEMPKEQLVNRMISCNCRFDLKKLRNPSEITSEEWEEIEDFKEDIIKSNIYIDDTPGLNLVELKIKLRRLVREQKIRLVIIDYLQLLIETKRFDSRQEEASYISRQLKTLARELKVPIICLSQLSRNVERRDSKRPIMSDLRESGAIEQDSDLIIFLFREDYYNQFIDRSLFAGVIDASVTELIVSKHRNGPIGVVETPFKINWNRFDKFEGKLLDLKKHE